MTLIPDVVVIGRAPAAHLRAAGRTDVAILDHAVTGAVFDRTTGSWVLTSADGHSCRGRVVVAGSPFTPWIPPLDGHGDFRGVTFHAAAPDPGFDPAGRRVAVLGADSAAGRFIERSVRAAKSVTVFALPPRRVVSKTRARRRHRGAPPVITAPIDRLTASGLRTRDGVHHGVDAIVYGTGFSVASQGRMLVGAGGLTLAQAWSSGMEPYLGVAVHGMPNYFFVSGPDPQTQARFVAECLDLTSAGSRIEVRRSSQQVFNERLHLSAPRHRPAASAFDLAPVATRDHDVYDGPATLTAGNIRYRVRVRLTGHVEPIDGHYHWQGMIFGKLPDDLHTARAVLLSAGDRTAPARVTERTPQGRYSIAGVGTPPFSLGDARGTAAQR